MVWVRFILILVFAGCSSTATEPQGTSAGQPIRLALEDRTAPEIFERDGLARRAPDDSTTGRWGVVGGLNSAERALVQNLDTGSSTILSLYRGRPRGEEVVIELSPEAADRIGLAEKPVQVRIVAIRQEPRLINQ